MTPTDAELIAELDDVLGAGGIRDLAFHVGQVKALVKHADALEAARDHLRAHLEQLQKYAQHGRDCEARQCDTCGWWDDNHDISARNRHHDMVPKACTCGLADLLAILSERQRDEKEIKS